MDAHDSIPAGLLHVAGLARSCVLKAYQSEETWRSINRVLRKKLVRLPKVLRWESASCLDKARQPCAHPCKVGYRPPNLAANMLIPVGYVFDMM
jgi:hypothetical protein